MMVPWLDIEQRWLIIESSGGLIQNMETSVADMAVVEIDYDELVDGLEPWDYYRVKLDELRESMYSGELRRRLRLSMAEALPPREERK